MAGHRLQGLNLAVVLPLVMDAFILPVVLLAMFYVLLFLPQQKRKKEYAALQSSLTEGDEVLLNSGVYGFITVLDDKVAWIEVSEDVELKVDRDAIARLISAPQDADEEDDEPEDSGSEKDSGSGKKGN